MRTVRLWDLPVRLCHWSFVVLLPLLWWSAENRRMDLHVTLGLVMLGLVTFRILWGLTGSSNARFSGFLKGPGTVVSYLKSLSGAHQPVAGHNPAGGWSVILLLTLLAVQVGLGLFTGDLDATSPGPLYHLVSYETGEALGEIHELLFNVIVAFVVLHVAAVVFYAKAKRDNLVTPMVTGSRQLPDSVTEPRLAPLWHAIPVAVIAAAFAWWISVGAPLSMAQYEASKAVPAEESYM